MSTNDVPGAKAANRDELSMGCWAEHEDGSLIFVESSEGNRVVFSLFDMAKKPIMEYRTAMPEVNFKKEFTWDPKDKSSIKWTWHDKTPFNWDRIIGAGFQEGMRYASAGDVLSAAQRIAERLNISGHDLQRSMHDHKVQSVVPANIMDKIHRALNELLK